MCWNFNCYDCYHLFILFEFNNKKEFIILYEWNGVAFISSLDVSGCLNFVRDKMRVQFDFMASVHT